MELSPNLKLPIQTQNALKRIFTLIFSCWTWSIAILLTLVCGASATVLGIISNFLGWLGVKLKLLPSYRTSVLDNLIHYIAVTWGTLLMWQSGGRVSFENYEKLYTKGSVVIMSNHQSMYDVMLLFRSLWKVQFRWMAKANLFKIPFFGWGMAGCGYIPVERGAKQKAIKSIFQAAKKVQGGASVLVFPEGTRSKLPKGEMLAFKGGGFLLAQRAGVVIQPITIWGSGKIIPVQDVLIQRVYPGKMRVIFHDPIMPEQYKDWSQDELMKYVRAKIAEPMERLNQEIPLYSEGS